MSTVIQNAAGQALRAVIAGIMALRRPRPIHPHGVVITGTIAWHPRGAPSGIAWIDQPVGAAEDVLARLSRSIGLPRRLPDIYGLALRSSASGGPADILLSSTGLGVPARFLLAAHLSPTAARFSSVLPYRGTNGPVLIAARTISGPHLPTDPAEQAVGLAIEPWTLQLLHATPGGRWRPFATLTLSAGAGPVDDDALRFVPLASPPPGAATYGWTHRLREPSYARAQRRSEEPAPT
ncbi:hypothetical protein [Planctomonas psychrotolerans]|uniref:hypothetical protein n=1 Tax=Planctomonas psychrotolerans TaxID=2528712 RepID=UPI001D0D03A7|nr:hypothetical protein [Planctomonas psychrotolerans]